MEKLPFQIGVAERGFAKPFVKIFKVGSHPRVDDYPINWKLNSYFLFYVSFLFAFDIGAEETDAAHKKTNGGYAE